MDLNALLAECAHREGFALAGCVDIDLAFAKFESKQPNFQAHLAHYDDWIQAGFAGSMEYLVRGRDRRANPRLLFPEAQSVFCVAIPYPARAAGAAEASEGPRYARYLQGRDYHIEVSERLERALQSAKAQWNSQHAESPELKWKICVDTSAVLERSWAALAGLGWIGKNTLLIHPQYGSYIFLAEALINLPTHRGPAPLPNYCGHCTRCLQACPTQAFEKPNVLNSNRCVSYWTLEKRGDLGLAASDKPKISRWIAGCDACQEACPFNSKAERKSGEIPPQNSTRLNQWRDLLLESTEEYQKRVKDSALKRVKPAQFSRNLAITLANVLDQSADPELKLGLAPLIQTKFEMELDGIAKAEWKLCLEIATHQTESHTTPPDNPRTLQI